MIIRDANLDYDIPALVEMAHEFAERAAPWTRLPDDDEVLGRIMTRVVGLGDVDVLLADDDGRVAGGLAMLYTPYLWNPSVTVAEELFWFARRDAPLGTGGRLLNEAMRRVRGRDAIPMFRALVTSPPGVAAAYRRYGLSPAETVFTEMP